MKEEGVEGTTAVAPAQPRDDAGRFAAARAEAAAAEVARDADEDKLLDALAAKHGMTLEGGIKPAGREAGEDEPPKGSKGQKATEKGDPKGEDSEEDAEAKPEESEETEESDDEEAEEAEDKQGYEAALEALRLDGYTRKDFEGMSREKITSLGTRRAKVQAELKRKLDERATLLNQQKSSTQTESDTAEPSRPEKQSAKLADLKKKAADEYGEDFASLLDEYVQAATGERGNGAGVHERTLSVLSESVEGLLIERARSELEDRFPKLAEKPVLAKVRKKMEVLAATGAYSDIGELMHDAASIVIGKEQAPAEKAKPRTKLSSQPHAPGRQVTKRPLTPDEADDIYLSARFDGRSHEDARRLIDR